jgi:hypothetical protein
MISEKEWTMSIEQASRESNNEVNQIYICYLLTVE